MARAERLDLVIGVAVIIILIGSAVFGVLGIAKPLTRIASVLGDLTNDRIVDVPYAARGDEIGRSPRRPKYSSNRSPRRW